VIRVGFIGLGNQGKPIAAHLAPAGLQTTVYDIVPEPVEELVSGGAKAAASPRELGAEADVVGICVPEDAHVRAVVYGDDGLLAGLAAGSVILIHSTILPETAVEVAEAAAATDVAVMDACVTGGASRAQSKQLTYLIGGPEAALEKARPYFEATTEVPVIHGLPQEVLEDAGRANGQLTDLMIAYLTTHKLPEEARKSDEFQSLMRGHMAIGEKDLAWALELARKFGVALPVASLVSQSMARLYGVDDDRRR